MLKAVLNFPKLRSPASHCSLLGGIVFLALAMPASASEFETRCAALANSSSVTVSLIDLPPLIEQSRSISELKGMKGMRGDSHHHILGLTFGAPFIEYATKSTLISDPHSSNVCLMPSLDLKIGLKELRIYLAKELNDPCRRNVILEHEQEHANTWRNHLRIASRLLAERIRTALGPARLFHNHEKASEALGPWLADTIKPFQQQLFQGIVASQQAIDSPHSYAMVEGRLRTCPPL